ncbi:uncharacterized protein LOC131876864 [Tigriopus californicus]|uniref:uncharacterized protein LOC131876864 n=1 Tax=Tigriopus californicus TaxID=6832 RepID=UPI0027DA2B6C|nr:uncharacterized protein LOC131876864 [Tigriopus californicus]
MRFASTSLTILGQWHARHATPCSTSEARLTLRYGRCYKTGSSPHIVGPYPGTDLPAIPGISPNDLDIVRRRDQTHRNNAADKFNAQPRSSPSSLSPGQWVLPETTSDPPSSIPKSRPNPT